MPLYEYECGCGHRFEELHTIEDRNKATCPICGESAHIRIAPSYSRMATPFSVLDHDGTVLHSRQTTEKLPPTGYRYENPNLVEA